VSLSNLDDLVQSKLNGGYCEGIYEQIRREAAVQGMTIAVTAAGAYTRSH
jgi:hypothetical protein